MSAELNEITSPPKSIYMWLLFDEPVIESIRFPKLETNFQTSHLIVSCLLCDTYSTISLIFHFLHSICILTECIISHLCSERASSCWKCSTKFWGRGCLWSGVHQCRLFKSRLRVVLKHSYWLFTLTTVRFNRLIPGESIMHPLMKVLLILHVYSAFQVKLSDYIGKKYVILFFYPLDFTFVCPTG